MTMVVVAAAAVCLVATSVCLAAEAAIVPPDGSPVLLAATVIRPPRPVSRLFVPAAAAFLGPAPCLGLLVPLRHDACSPQGWADQIGTMEPWVGLVSADGCPASRKVANALASRAAGLVIYSDHVQYRNSSDFIPSGQSNQCIIFLNKESGLDLMEKLYENGTKIIVDVSQEHPEVAFNRRLFSLLLLTFCLLVLSILVKVLHNFCIMAPQRITRPDTPVTLQEMSIQAIAKIPSKKLTQKDVAALPGEVCSICLEEYCINDIVRILPCRHEFHMACLDPWLLDTRKCPLCKMEVLIVFGIVSCGSLESIINLTEEDEEIAVEHNNSQ